MRLVVPVSVAAILCAGCRYSYPEHIPEDTTDQPTYADTQLQRIYGAMFFDLSSIPEHATIVRAEYRLRRRSATKENIGTFDFLAYNILVGLDVRETSTNVGQAGMNILFGMMRQNRNAPPPPPLGYILGLTDVPDISDRDIDAATVTTDRATIWRTMGIPGDYFGGVLGHHFDDNLKPAILDQLRVMGSGADDLERWAYYTLLTAINPPLRCQLTPGIWDRFDVTDAVRNAFPGRCALFLFATQAPVGVSWYLSSMPEGDPRRPHLLVEYIVGHDDDAPPSTNDTPEQSPP